MAEMNAVDWIAYVLVIVGALNWGLAVFDMNLVASVFGVSIVAKVVYALVALSGLWMIYKAFK